MNFGYITSIRIIQLDGIGPKQMPPTLTRRDSVDPESGQCSSSGATDEPSPTRKSQSLQAPAPDADGGGGGETVQYTSDTEECYIAEAERELTQLVRKRLLPCLRDLIAHGMFLVRRSLLLFTLLCSSLHSSPVAPHRPATTHFPYRSITHPNHSS